ncbi:MAG TPA: hypothetical protein VIH21_03835 [Dehalococcoidia bacterium]
MALVPVACGGGDSKKAARDEPTQSAAASPTSRAASVALETVTINKSFWHAGWKVTLDEASAADAEVAIDATFENLGDDTSTFDSQLVLTADGENYTESTFDQDLPQVPGNLKGKGKITFQVDDTFSFDDAALIVGNPKNNQAIVPIGASATEKLVTLEPVILPITGSATAGAVTLNVTGVEVRADMPEKHSITEKGKKLIIVKFSATVGSGIPIGEGVLQDPNVALKLPDGTAVAVRSDGVSGVNELLQGKEGTTISDLSVRFEVPDPVKGNYAFVVRGKYVADRSTAEGELPFTVP